MQINYREASFGMTTSHWHAARRMRRMALGLFGVAGFLFAVVFPISSARINDVEVAIIVVGIMLLIAGAAFDARARHAERMVSQRRLCPECDYDLRGADHDVCPECGVPIKSEPSA